MKNLFFTAISLVAFSGVSLANTIADEETILNVNNEKSVVVTNPTCMQYAADKCEAQELQYGCMSTTQYNHAFWAYYNKCLDKSISAQ